MPEEDFGAKMDGVTRERKLHNESLNVLYPSSNVTRFKKKDAMGGACGACWRKERCDLGIFLTVVLH